jgi:hypothetical protein
MYEKGCIQAFPLNFIVANQINLFTVLLSVNLNTFTIKFQ